MKIKVIEKSYQEVLKEPAKKNYKPIKTNYLFRYLLKLVSKKDLNKTNFKCEKVNMDKISKKEECLFLMNHSSFIDLKIASTILYPRPFNIVTTEDGFIGKSWLMRHIGCIPTRKFVSDSLLVKNMIYCVKKLHSSILMYPEASYSFDGTCTPLPTSIGKCIKLLKIPVVTIITEGAFLRDPLYNNLQIRQTNVSCKMEYVLSKEDINKLSIEEINKIINEKFSFDNFRTQQEKNILITEPFRADHLERVIYKCPHCLKEGFMVGKGIYLTCKNCSSQYELTENGFLKGQNSEILHIPDLYKWERECVKKEIENGEYHLDEEVEIFIMKNYKCVYKIGDGNLHHDINGFILKNDEFTFKQPSLASYSLYSDFYWYEKGDIIAIGDNNMEYYCFPKNSYLVAKTRLATEEIYKMLKEK